MRVARRLLIVCMLVAATACVTSKSSAVYSRQQTQRAYTVYNATVLELRVVEIEGKSGRVGTLGGAWIGSTAARSAGDGHGSSVLGAVGGVAGAIIGRGAERELTANEGFEIILKLDNDEIVAVVQGADVVFTVGERVRVLRDGASARVTKKG